ncbi:MAG: hypothetical protein GY737_18055 [Desulfobacteraceae bacterium]|nr:hypothetical protein [Desulfobacteraceae bacterium]
MEVGMGKSIILENANVITEEGRILKNKWIRIVDGKINEIADSEMTDSAGEKIECSGLFVSPGFVNMHVHSPMTIFRGIAEDVHL